MAAIAQDPLQAIRDPDAIRVRLARAVREADALRRLLKIAESADLRECDNAAEARRDD